MSEYKLSFVDDSAIQLLEKIEQYYEYLKEPKKHDLPIPSCVSNEFILIKDNIKQKWLADFPDFKHVCSELESSNRLFSVPYEEHHYLYYHMLRAYKKLFDNSQVTADFSSTFVPYSHITNALYKRKEDATDFFERYLDNERGISLVEHDIRKFDFNKEPVSKILPSEKLDIEACTVEQATGETSSDYFIVQKCQGCHKV